MEIEYLTEWPPKEAELQKSMNIPPSKKPKHDPRVNPVSANPSSNFPDSDFNLQEHYPHCAVKEGLYDGLTPGEVELVKSDPTIKADLFLARWWKQSSTTDTHLTEHVDLETSCVSGSASLKTLKVHSSDPQTQLFHIARY